MTKLLQYCPLYPKSFNLTKRFELTVSTRPKFSIKIFISKYASACIYTSLNIECGLHAHVPCVLASNVDYTLVLHGDEDDETTEILLKFRDQIRNLLFKKTNESNEPEPGTLIWLLFNGMLCTV
ncbi:hypothetical protein CUMW_117080 [Citrus unshiu]|nr:hypothetical protein CUMW_117080 [Citrus unshiu]